MVVVPLTFPPNRSVHRDPGDYSCGGQCYHGFSLFPVVDILWPWLLPRFFFRYLSVDVEKLAHLPMQPRCRCLPDSELYVSTSKARLNNARAWIPRDMVPGRSKAPWAWCWESMAALLTDMPVVIYHADRSQPLKEPAVAACALWFCACCPDSGWCWKWQCEPRGKRVCRGGGGTPAMLPICCAVGATGTENRGNGGV